MAPDRCSNCSLVDAHVVGRIDFSAALYRARTIFPSPLVSKRCGIYDVAVFFLPVLLSSRESRSVVLRRIKRFDSIDYRTNEMKRRKDDLFIYSTFISIL